MRSSLLAVALLTLVSSGVHAQKTLDFFDIPHDIDATESNLWAIPDGYGGLNWMGGYALDPRYSAVDWGAFVLAGDAVGFTEGFYRDRAFRFFGLYVGNDVPWFDLEGPPPGWPFRTATVSAYLHGRLVRTVTVAEPSTWSDMVDWMPPAFMDFGGARVDSVVTYGATAITGVTVDVTPEPMSMALLATGLLGLGAVAWRRRRQRAV